jgi:hypothetical protein
VCTSAFHASTHGNNARGMQLGNLNSRSDLEVGAKMLEVGWAPLRPCRLACASGWCLGCLAQCAHQPGLDQRCQIQGGGEDDSLLCSLPWLHARPVPRRGKRRTASSRLSRPSARLWSRRSTIALQPSLRSNRSSEIRWMSRSQHTSLTRVLTADEACQGARGLSRSPSTSSALWDCRCGPPVGRANGPSRLCSGRRALPGRTFLIWLPQRPAPGAIRKADGEPPTVAVKTIRRYPHDAEVRSLPYCMAGARSCTAPVGVHPGAGVPPRRAVREHRPVRLLVRARRRLPHGSRAALNQARKEVLWRGAHDAGHQTVPAHVEVRPACHQGRAHTHACAFAGSTWCLSTISTCDKWEASRWRRTAGGSRRTAYR